MAGEKLISFGEISAVDFAKQLTVYQSLLWQRVSSYDILMYKPPDATVQVRALFVVNTRAAV